MIALKVLESNLEAGEGEAICLYEEMDADLLIIDDLEGRRVAERLGINITGTLGVLLLAKREKFIDKVKPLLDEIVGHGFRVADELYREILIKADEIKKQVIKLKILRAYRSTKPFKVIHQIQQRHHTTKGGLGNADKEHKRRSAGFIKKST